MCKSGVAATKSTTSDGNRNYSFTGLANGSYTITPGKTGYTFAPANKAVTVKNADLTGQSFTATFVGTHTITATA